MELTELTAPQELKDLLVRLVLKVVLDKTAKTDQLERRVPLVRVALPD